MLSFAISFLALFSINAQEYALQEYQLSERGIPFFAPVDEPYMDQEIQHAPKAIFKKAKKTVLPSGTLVEFESIESIPWQRATIGKNIRFKVYRDVKVNGKILISAGTIAFGEIRDIIEATPNSPEAVFIEIERVPAVDGQMIDLSGIQERVSNRLPGESVNLPSKLSTSGYVLNSRTISTQ